MEERRQHYNEHRAGKRSFQALLKPEEADLVQMVKTLKGIQTDRELLINLCEDEKARFVASSQIILENGVE